MPFACGSPQEVRKRGVTRYGAILRVPSRANAFMSRNIHKTCIKIQLSVLYSRKRGKSSMEIVAISQILLRFGLLGIAAGLLLYWRIIVAGSPQGLQDALAASDFAGFLI